MYMYKEEKKKNSMDKWKKINSEKKVALLTLENHESCSILKGKFGFWGSHLDSILECLFLYIFLYITFQKFSFHKKK